MINIEITFDFPKCIEFHEAWLYCLTLTHNGHKDWRLPTFDEYIVTSDLRDCWYDDAFYDTGILKHTYPVRTKEAPL